jgi:predicted Zn-dependent protease
LEIDNSNSEYWITLAKVYNDCNRPKDAEDALVKAAELEADNTEVWLTWVDIFLNFGELKNALRVLKSGLEKNDDSLLKYRMVSLLLESKHEKEAFEMLEKAMKQEFVQINYLFDIYPKALKNKRLQKLVDDFREENNF